MSTILQTTTSIFLTLSAVTLSSHQAHKTIEARIQEATKQLSHTNTAIRILGLKNLLGINSKKTVPILITQITDPHNYIRFQSIKRLSALKYKEAGEPLIKRLSQEKEFHIQKALIEALGTLRIEKARLPLERLTKHSSILLRKSAEAALKELNKNAPTKAQQSPPPKKHK